MNKNIALITGITGQDGSYLAEFLLAKGYEVHGTIRRSSVDYRERIAHLEGKPNFHLHYADLGDSMSILGVIGKVRPTEIYNLAAQSHVQVSFDSPEFTADVDAVGVLRILEAVRQLGLKDQCRIYQPKMNKIFEQMLPIYGTPQEQEVINEKFPQCENISVDYAIMEKAEEIFVCPADFGWSDLGTWGSLQTQTKRDIYGNACIGDNIQMIESHNCMVHATQEKKVVIQGLDGAQ